MSHEIRVDGLYKSPLLVDQEEGEIYWRYLRFRIDGTLTMVTCTGTEEDVAQWIEEHKHLAKGLYSVVKEKIEFWVKMEDDHLKTRFEGIITDNLLRLRMWDSNKNFDVTDVYTFHPVNINPPKIVSQNPFLK